VKGGRIRQVRWNHVALKRLQKVRKSRKIKLSWLPSRLRSPCTTTRQREVNQLSSRERGQE
jgi:hypothetical protein